MAGIVPSLFGPTPQELEAQRRQQQAELQQAYAAQSPQAASGAAVGTLIGQGLSSLFGTQDPAIERATKVYSVLQEVQNELGQDVTDPTKLYPALSAAFSDAGLTDMASKVAIEGYEKIGDWNKQQASIKKDLALAEKALRENDPKEKAFYKLVESGKVSPASIKAAIDAGMDFSLLDINDKEKKSAFAQQLIDAGYKEGSTEFQNKMKEFIDSEISGKKKGTGNVMIGAIGLDTGKAGEAAGKVIGEATALIENKYSALDSIKEAKTVLSQGINAGIYGPTKQFITKATGGLIGSPEKVVNTEQFLSYIGNTVIPRLQEFGGNDSVEELKYLQNVMGGNQTLEPESTKRILESAERKIKLGIERLERQTKSAGTKEGLPLDKGPTRAAEETTAPTVKRRKYIPGQGFVEAQ